MPVCGCGVKTLEMYPAFGWETKECLEAAAAQKRARINDDPETNENFSFYLNIIKVAGYFPLVNVIMGLAVAYFANNDRNAEMNSKEKDLKEVEHYTSMRSRGIQMIVFGPCLAVTDLLFTIRDQFALRAYKAAQTAPISTNGLDEYDDL